MSGEDRKPSASFFDQLKVDYIEPHPSLPPLDDPARRLSMPPPHLKDIGHTPEDSRHSLKSDLPSSLVVFLVALPLCLGIALASNVPPLAGLISGVIGGIFVAALSKSPLAVSGPAAGLTAVVVTGIDAVGYEGFLVAVVIAGVLQIIFGLARAGIFAYYFPSAVIKGMLAAIGVILILKQLPHAIGFSEGRAEHHILLDSLAPNTFTDIPLALGHFHLGAGIISLVGLVILIVMGRSQRLKEIQWLPAPLVVVVVGVLLNTAFGLFAPDLALQGELLVNVPTGGLGEVWAEMRAPDFSLLATEGVYTLGFTIAAVASIETLLCIEAIDKLDPFKRSTPTNRELMAQGAGNIVAGLLGALPITAVIVRGSANVQAGGRTRASSFFHGVWLLLAVVAIPFVMNLIPLAALAAVLLYVGYKLSPYTLFYDMIQRRPVELSAPFIVTIFGVLFTDLLKGVGAGMLVAVFFILKANLKVSHFIHHQESHEIHKKKYIKIELSENVSFLNKASVSKVLHELPEKALVEIDGTGAHHIHPDVLELIHDFADTAHTRDIEVLLTSLPEADPSQPLH